MQRVGDFQGYMQGRLHMQSQLLIEKQCSVPTLCLLMAKWLQASQILVDCPGLEQKLWRVWIYVQNNYCYDFLGDFRLFGY
jgi:ABC-type microcin C transport system permease subunit YejE